LDNLGGHKISRQSRVPPGKEGPAAGLCPAGATGDDGGKGEGGWGRGLGWGGGGAAGPPTLRVLGLPRCDGSYSRYKGLEGSINCRRDAEHREAAATLVRSSPPGQELPLETSGGSRK
jgi:hypothetical protein